VGTVTTVPKGVSAICEVIHAFLPEANDGARMENRIAVKERHASKMAPNVYR
jgi:hypothetical protein